MRPTSEMCTVRDETRRKGHTGRVLVANTIFSREKLLNNKRRVPGRRLGDPVPKTILLQCKIHNKNSSNRRSVDPQSLSVHRTTNTLALAAIIIRIQGRTSGRY